MVRFPLMLRMPQMNNQVLH
uniref:Uncharacterized protein n=1 Tax=Rhizophora mucronata TaxID=61149 RepID=A0A2P2QBW2_RHIMU